MFTKYLVRRFIKNYEQTDKHDVRSQYGYLCGIVGVVANLLLFTIKLVVGIFASSIAIIADAFNNLSDVGSSSVTILGFKMSRKPADPEHPFGHGRVEYISGLVVAFLVLFVGVEFLQTSFKRILSPQDLTFSWIPFILLIVSILIKVWLSQFNRHIGQRINSDALKAAGVDAISDVISTSVVVFSYLLSKYTELPLDGYIGLVVSIIIIFAGYGLIRDTINPLLGTAPDEQLVQSLQEQLLSYPYIHGVHDLYVHNYGPGRTMATIHVEVPSNVSVVEIHDIIDQAEKDCLKKLGIQLVIHCDPIITNDETVLKAKEDLVEVLESISHVHSFHDFRLVREGTNKTLVFDVVVDHQYHFSAEHDSELKRVINDKLKEIDSNYRATMTIEKISLESILMVKEE